jgi:hypothetical protein
MTLPFSILGCLVRSPLEDIEGIRIAKTPFRMKVWAGICWPFFYVANISIGVIIGLYEKIKGVVMKTFVLLTVSILFLFVSIATGPKSPYYDGSTPGGLLK